jgi:hypothetical protein
VAASPRKFYGTSFPLFFPFSFFLSSHQSRVNISSVTCGKNTKLLQRSRCYSSSQEYMYKLSDIVCHTVKHKHTAVFLIRCIKYSLKYCSKIHSMLVIWISCLVADIPSAPGLAKYCLEFSDALQSIPLLHGLPRI